MNNSTEASKKKPYLTPEVMVHGNIEAVTLANQDGTRLDAPYPTGTPEPVLTFS